MEAACSFLSRLRESDPHVFCLVYCGSLRLTVVCETKWKSVVCEMEICSLRNENLKGHDIPFTGKHEPNELTCSPLCDCVAQLVRALHRHRRGHGFESR